MTVEFKYEEDHTCENCCNWRKDQERLFHGKCGEYNLLTYMKAGRDCDGFGEQTYSNNT